MQTHNFTPRHAKRMGGGWSVFRGRNVSNLCSAPHGYKPKANTMTDDKFYSKPTQVFWTCKALLDGRTISHRTEIREVRGWRLGAIIHRLKTEYAWPIHTAYSAPDNVAFYSLKTDVDRTALSFPRSAAALGKLEGAE
jgi:hypothetical protein